MKKQIYTILFIFSLLVFFINLLIQGQIIFTYSDSYGLLFKMNLIYWSGYIILIFLIYFQLKNYENIDKKYSYLTLILLTIYLIGTPFFYERLPRFGDSWAHSFIASEMFRNKQVYNDISIYEDYPGTFLFYGLLYELLPAYHVMKFLPVFLYMVGALSIYLIFKNLSNEKTAFLISIFYMFFNWTVEDNHISPQFLTLTLYLVFIFVLIKFLKDKENKNKYFLLLVLLSAAIVVSHPFTPIFLFFILGSVIVLCKKIRFSLIPVIVILFILFSVYELYITTTLKMLARDISTFIEVLFSGSSFERVTYRLISSQFSRQVFLGSRIGITIVSIFLGLMGIRVLYGKKYTTEAKFFLAWAFSLIPFLIFVSQVLKGEYYERFVLISSLPLAALTVYFLSGHKVKPSFIFIFLLVLSPLFFIGKYGNEAFESISTEKMITYCYSHQYNTDCEENSVISPIELNYQLENFGKTYFEVSRESIMASSIYMDETIDSIEKKINDISERNEMDRIYSTSIAGAYR